VSPNFKKWVRKNFLKICPQTKLLCFQLLNIYQWTVGTKLSFKLGELAHLNMNSLCIGWQMSRTYQNVHKSPRWINSMFVKCKCINFFPFHIEIQGVVEGNPNVCKNHSLQRLQKHETLSGCCLFRESSHTILLYQPAVQWSSECTVVLMLNKRPNWWKKWIQASVESFV